MVMHLKLAKKKVSKKKLAKKKMFNLSDGEEDTYEDGALGGKDDFDNGLLMSDEDLQDDDDDLEASGSKRLKHLNRNRGSGEEERHKSKKEVMEEIIMKSKLGRVTVFLVSSFNLHLVIWFYFVLLLMEKAKHKEEKEKLLDEVDKEFMSLDSQVLGTLYRPSDTPEDKDENYGMLMYDMSRERRGRPTERTKIPEEIAQEERQKLEELEANRKKRMQETEDLSDGDDGDESTKRQRAFSGDDLGDSFSVHEEQPKKGWINEVLERKDDSDNSESDEDDGSSEDSESEEGEEDDDEESDESDSKHRKGHHLKDWELSDNELEAELEDDDDDDGEEVEPRVHKKSKIDNAAQHQREGFSGIVKLKNDMKKLSSTQRDIPFVIDAPENFEELIALVEDCTNADVIVIVSRIRTSNSIKLAAGNEKKYAGLL